MIIGFARAVIAIIFNSFSFVGSLANQTNSPSVTTADAALPLNAEQTDTNTFHDLVTNNSRMTIPVALNGKLVMIQGTVNCASSGSLGRGVRATIRKNAAEAYDGMGMNADGSAITGSDGISVSTQPITVATNDFFEMYVQTTETTCTANSNYCSLKIWQVGS